MDKTLMQNVNGATVDFYEYTLEGTQYYEFNTSKSGPPEPMVNAMVGLKLLDSDNKKLVMINMHTPKGLFPKIENDYNWDIEDLDSGDTKITFYRKNPDSQTTTNYEDNSCDGNQNGLC